MKYRIDDTYNRFQDTTFRTLAEARKALRRSNNGRLYGKFEPEGEGVEGWNLGQNEGCATAVIVLGPRE